MRQLAMTDPLIDDLEAMIDESHDDPAKAALMKARVRARLARVPKAVPSQAPDRSGAADGEEFWDNVPL